MGRYSARPSGDAALDSGASEKTLDEVCAGVLDGPFSCIADTGIAALYMSQANNEMFVSLIKQLRENAEIRIFSDLL